MNPNALVFWALLGIIGWFIAGATGALAGVGLGLAISLIANAL